MKNLCKNTMGISLIFMLLVSVNIQAEEWGFGVGMSVASGFSDVVDIYERNFEIENPFYIIEESEVSPIGVNFEAAYQYDSGLRLGVGAGPIFIIAGDMEHFELPINATVGYTLSTGADTSPYIKVGIVDHYVSGDYVEGATPGLLAAVGVEFARSSFVSYTAELAIDKSIVELQRLDLGPTATEDVNSYDIVFSFRAVF